MFDAPAAEQAGCARDINEWFKGGRLKANIDHVLPLSEAAESHRLQEENTVGGKATLGGELY